jgi:hypothetical protein
MNHKCDELERGLGGTNSRKPSSSGMTSKKTIALGFAGDLMLGGEPVQYAKERSLVVTYPFKALSAELGALDVLFVNLEGPLFGNQAAALRKPLLLSNHSDVVEVLKLPKTCVCNLANNHILDYGQKGLTRTRTFLDNHGIQYVGAGRNAAEAGQALILEQAGWRIACLAFTTDGPGVRSIIARNGNPGCATLRDTPALLQQVRSLKEQADLVIVMLHWGREYFEYPGPAQVRLAHALVEAGADVIAGHHAHALQAVEEYNGAVIAYSLGHLFMPPFRLPDNGPVFYPRPASKEFVIMRAELRAGGSGSVDFIAGGLDSQFTLRPFNRIALQSFRSRLDDLAWPLGQEGYPEFWRNYREWRQRELKVFLRRGPDPLSKQLNRKDRHHPRQWSARRERCVTTIADQNQEGVSS